MASVANTFTSVYLTYRDVKEAHPSWSDKSIEDYLSIKRDLVSVAEETDDIEGSLLVNPALHAQLNDVQQRIGSGDALTWDDDGFTWDADVFTWDQDEA